MSPTFWLQRGREAESLGRPAEALHCFDAARALLATAPRNREAVRLHALAWMNRGNVLQKQSEAAAVADAIAAYDEAIALLGSRPIDAALQQHLGAAWLNRGHTLQRFAAPARIAEAIRSHRRAIALLAPLAATEPSAPANLAGAWINLADTLLVSDEHDRANAARAAAREALALTAAAEASSPVFAELGLMARRAHAAALAALLADAFAPAYVGEISDTIDSALALARQWEREGVDAFRSLVERFFRFGVGFYGRYQPHFLGEFVLETLRSPAAPAAWSAEPTLQAIARDALEAALADLRTPRLLVAGEPRSERMLETHRALSVASAELRAAFRHETQPVIV